MRVAISHDYLREYGGAERVLETIHEMFPDAPIFTAYLNTQKMGPYGERFAKWDIRTSWMQKVPFANRLLSPFRIFAPLMFESFDLSEYDLVISSSSAVYFAKSVITKPETLHISYIHTPPRFLYGFTTSFNYKKHWWTRILGELINHFLRIYDFEVSQRPDVLVANSKNVQARITKFYRRESVVIYPPVDVKDIRHQTSDIRHQSERKYYLSLGRLVRGKGIEIIVEACSKLNLPLKVVGTGPELERLKGLAGKNVEFLGWVSDAERAELYKNAKALILASEDEDFGITSVESQAAGMPVLAIRAGGYLETIEEGKTGEFFDEANIDCLIEALEKFKPESYKKEDLYKNAEKFSKENFIKQLNNLINNNLKTK